MLSLITKIIKFYHIQILSETIKDSILSHPDYPNINCISDSFDSWRIKHTVAHLSLDRLCILDIPAISSFSNGDYIWILQVTKDKVYYKTDTFRLEIKDRIDFEKQWTGVSLVIENVNNAQEHNYKIKHKKILRERICKYSLCGAIIFISIIFTSVAWGNDTETSFLIKLLLLLNNIFGWILSFLLLKKETNHSRSFLHKFCKIGSIVDCNEVINSKWAIAFLGASWSSIGIAYFTTVIIWILFAPINSNWVIPLWWIFLGAFPFIIWSLFTQTFLIKKYCLFCCLTLISLCLNIIFIDFIKLLDVKTPILESIILITVFGALVLAAIYLKCIKSNRHIHLKRELARIKYNRETLYSHLSNEKYEIEDLGFTWGDIQSDNEVAIYVSLSCVHCNRAVKELNWLIDTYPKLRYRLILDVNSDNINDYQNRIICQLYYIYHSETKEFFFDTISALYDKQTEELSANGSSSCQINNVQGIINTTFRFCQNSRISFTPALFINSKLLSNLYAYNNLTGIIQTLSSQ